VSGEKRQLVRFLFYRLNPAWRRLPERTQVEQKKEFAETILGFRAKLLLRTYSLMGTRGDADLLFWQVAEDLETLQRFETAVCSTRLGGYLEVGQSYLSTTRKSSYEFPEFSDLEQHVTVQPADNRYLYVYPFVKTRAWYALAHEQRQEMMTEHVRVGRKYAGVRINTTYSFGLDDQEFVVTFENDEPGEFVDLVMDLRGSASSAYTERDTPVFTCIQMSLFDSLDALGGAAIERVERGNREDGFTSVAEFADVPSNGCGKRVYLGTEALALFQVDGKCYAVDDRCTHGRASLSEGLVDLKTCTLTCPWHDGKFELETGKPVGGPPRVAIKAYQVKIEDGQVLVAGVVPQIAS
jgi:chlorite dismutase/nitrite reductase/ring-hydroxylating ferredoxin subunit